jgi:glucokinase
LQTAVAHYLNVLETTLGSGYTPPKRAAFAVATAICGDQVSLTNANWTFSTRGMTAELGLTELRVLNDFEALATAVPYLAADQRRPTPGFDPRMQAAGTLAVIGPGTGLGVAAVTPCQHGWVVLAGEGGHATLAATDDFEASVLAAARQRHPHVSAERLLSGIGLPVLHQAVAAVMGQQTDVLTSETIVAHGVANVDTVASQTLSTFCAMLGSFAGSTALTLGARGGVFIAGGIVPRLAEYFFASRFREKFVAKGRFEGYLHHIPTWLITDTLVSLDGSARVLVETHNAASQGML